ncbi:glycosyltransferase [Colwellia psychrerythraea]|uniref:Glycosyl transferase group 1 n=1 Tax=Colwellia psychrerythraea TaxID=28229 RepID=A0A099KG87_COLPS|nr:glycosyltransferase [Colwellia psychrerythraea]KGJ89012.1 glycosyl transferase group 1 [Colwellia psychrerythraea]
MKNIVIVIDGLTGGGAERVMISLATEIVRQGHKVTILSLSNRCDYVVPEGITVCYLFNHKASKVDRLWQLKSSVAKIERWFFDYEQQSTAFDLVLSNLDRSNNLLAKSCIRSVYYIIHNSVEEELQRQKKLGPFAYWYLYKSKKNLSGKDLICVSKGIEQEIKQGDVIQAQSIATIYNPFDIDDIQNKSLIVDNAIPQEPYIIHVGRLAKQKRHDILFEAFSRVSKEVKLVLLCNKPKKVLKMASKYGVADRLILPGFQANAYNWIRNARALILSSDYEGLPTVLLEAIAVNTKVVSTACPHGPDEILTGSLGDYLVPRREPEALAEAINRILITELDLSEADILNKVKASNIAKKYLNLAG